MGQYGDCAVLAARLVAENRVKGPIEAWDLATSRLITSAWARKKGGPRAAFLGLCEEGLIKGIAPGNYTGSMKNKAVAIHAVGLLRKSPPPLKKSDLWGSITGYRVVQAGQLDVVMTLWDKGLIGK